MPLSERNTRPRFQVALEGGSPLLVSELDDDINGPWAVPRCVNTPSCVVFGMALRYIRRQGGVLPRRDCTVLENVNEALRHC
jgi:hypothetical protein